MEVSDIRDSNCLRDWLAHLPQETETEREKARRWATAIALRVAMRVLPIFWETFRFASVEAGKTAIEEKKSEALSPERIALVISVLLERPVVELMEMLVYEAKSYLFEPLSRSHIFAMHAVVGWEVSAAENAARATEAARTDLLEVSLHSEQCGWPAIRADCEALVAGKNLHAEPLWSDQNPLSEYWAAVRSRVLAQGDGWRFWVDWYDNALQGRPQDYDLLTKIALIDPEDWDKGADHVNALIADIRIKHLAETRPLGEDAIDQGADGVWHRAGRSDIDRDILQDACDSVRDEIARLRGKLQGPQGNMFTALVADIDLLDERLGRYPDRPLRLHDTFLRVQANIVYNLDKGELPDDVTVRDLNSVLSTAAMDMRNACPKTKSVVEARVAARFDEADEAARADLERLAEAAATLSDAELAQEFREDAQVATDLDALEVERQPALYRLLTRLSVMICGAVGSVAAALVALGGLKSGTAAFTDIVYVILRFFLSV